MCCGRRRYCVVLLGFLGLLISIGSREVFTMIVTHVISHNVTAADDELSGLSICVSRITEFLMEAAWYVSSFIFLYRYNVY